MTPIPDQQLPAIQIETVPEDRRSEALQLFFHHNLPTTRKLLVEQWLAANASGEVPLDGLIWALVQGRPVGVGFYSRHPGSTAFVWKPMADPSCLVLPSDPSTEEIQIALLREIGHRLDAENVRIGQILSRPEPSERELFTAGGFRWTTDLHYLLHSLKPTSSSEVSPDWVRTAYDHHNSESVRLFADVLERTWQATQDCPELNGLRTGAEALEGHREGVECDKLFWSLFIVENKPIGLCLLNPRDNDIWELVYVGVVPEARGHQFGQAMIRHALDAAREHRQSGVVLAVDSRNDVARRIYHDIGFTEIDRLAVYLRLRH